MASPNEKLDTMLNKKLKSFFQQINTQTNTNNKKTQNEQYNNGENFEN